MVCWQSLAFLDSCFPVTGCSPCVCLIKKQIQLSIKITVALFKDSWSRQHPIYQLKRSSKRYRKQEILYPEESRNKEVVLGKKRKQIGYCKVTFLRGAGRHLSADCPSYADQVFLIDWAKAAFKFKFMSVSVSNFPWVILDKGPLLWFHFILITSIETLFPNKATFWGTGC